MANEYVTLTEAKEWLGIGNTDQDTILDIVREAASRQIDEWCGRRFYLDATTSVRYYTTDDPTLIFVEDVDSAAPTITVETDDNDDGTFEQAWIRDNVTSFGYRLEPLNADEDGRPHTSIRALAGVFPRSNRGIKVTAKHGFSAILPPAVKQAALLTVEANWRSSGLLHATAGSPGVSSIALEGSDTVSFDEDVLTSDRASLGIPPSAQLWLTPFVRVK
ncbi:MAG: phage head-tail connector protein [Actinobacteria bacterium]|nr:phage head-tail connector protein [Actinomycetota bacterium]